MKVREIQAKTLLSSAKEPDPWFGIKYTMNLYRGCMHRCIYCDSRSLCYGIEDFDGEILVKANAIDLLRRELPRKRVKGYIGTGSMNDPYMPLERHTRLTARALEVIAEQRFPVHVLTKSDLVLRDVDLLKAIAEATGGPEGALVSFTITTADDELAEKLEPGAAEPTARFGALEMLAAAGLRTGVMLMPVLPFIEDSVENITEVVTRARACGASHVVAFFGMTLRDRSRMYYYAQLDRLFPGLRERYEQTYGQSYGAASPQAARLEAVFAELATHYNLARCVPPYLPPAPAQMPLF
jgi:DNA repair photolyase